MAVFGSQLSQDNHFRAIDISKRLWFALTKVFQVTQGDPFLH